MKLIYKCDFCSTFNKNKAVIEQHEKDCEFNPSNTTCSTCIFQEIDMYGGNISEIYCRKGFNMEKGKTGQCDKYERE